MAHSSRAPYIIDERFEACALFANLREIDKLAARLCVTAAIIVTVIVARLFVHSMLVCVQPNELVLIII